MKKIFTCSLLMLLFAITSNAQMRYFQASLQGSQEVPANASAASGVVIVKYDPATRFLELFGDYQNLTAAASASHIHSPGPVGVNAPVLITLANTGGTTGTITGAATLTAVQENDLYSSNMYVNVHNATYPGGEIRGQLYGTNVGQTEYFNGRLQGAQQLPPNASAGTGSINVLLDKVNNYVYLTGSFAGLTTAAQASHIHTGAPNVNGPVFVNLSFSAATNGTVHLASQVTATNATDMINGNTYVNIHNATYPDGEIRAQITNLSTNRFLKATLQGSQEVPANASPGRGTVIVKYNVSTRLFELIGDYQNVTAAINASHIHSPAPAGANAPVLFNLTNTGGTSGTLTGSATLTPAQEADLLNGLMYVNVHNANYPNGEIREQLTPTAAGSSEYLTGILQGVQQVPSNASAAAGKLTALLDKSTNQVFLTGNFSGLTTAAAAGHIHRGQAGVNGPVVVPLSVTTAVAGTITGSATVTASFADSMVRGFTYVNIHNATYPDGEIRAQLGDLVLPVKLNYFNGYKNGNQIVLIWESSEEINLDRYVIEQQNDNGQWIAKATINAAGGANATKYTQQDMPLSTSKDYVLYRLKIADKDGKYAYSPIIKIYSKQTRPSLQISANPIISNELRFNITGISVNKKAEVTIVDNAGRYVLKTTINTLSNSVLQIHNLASGMYNLVVRLDDAILQENFIK